MIKYKVLFISSWYPTRDNPTLGNFIFKHAESVSIYHDLYALHVCLSDNKINKREVDYSEKPFRSKVIYIMRSGIWGVGKLVDRIRIFRCYLNEYRRLSEDGFVPDLVHSNVVYPIAFIAWLYKLLFGVRFLIEEHWTGYHDYVIPKPGKFKMQMIRFLANHAVAILPDSVDLGRAMQRHGVTAPVIPFANVVDVHVFTPVLESKQTNTVKLVHVSTLDNTHKNIDLLLKAFSQLIVIYPDTELHFVTDGDFNQYVDLINELEIEDKLINHGRHDAAGVAKVLRACDYFVLTSNFENLPCVLIESISCGVPVIATDVGGVSEIVNQGNGLIVPPDALDELVGAMKIMHLEYTYYDKLKMHKEAVEKYSYESIGVQLSDIYTRLNERRNS